VQPTVSIGLSRQFCVGAPVRYVEVAMRAVAGLFDTPVTVRKIIEELSAEGFDPQLVSVFTNSPQTGTGVRTGETSEEALRPDVDTPAADPRTGIANSEPMAPLPTSPLTGAQVTPAGPKDSVPHEKSTGHEVKTNVGKIPGGLHKALTAWGFAAEDIRQYEHGVAQGRVLAVVELTDDQMAARATQILRQRGAEHLVFRGQSPANV
jgi:hypothetical protein